MTIGAREVEVATVTQQRDGLARELASTSANARN